jgi:hypothetical protein
VAIVAIILDWLQRWNLFVVQDSSLPLQSSLEVEQVTETLKGIPSIKEPLLIQKEWSPSSTGPTRKANKVSISRP